MKKAVYFRAVALGEYIADTGATVRATAKVFKISKSTVHKEVTQRLPHLDAELAQRVRKVLDTNLNQRHLRGGAATKAKYMHFKDGLQSKPKSNIM